MKGKSLFILLLSAILVSSCIPKKKLIYTQDQKGKVEQSEYINIRPEKTIQPFDNVYIKVSSIDEKVNSVFQDQNRSGSESNINLLSYTVSQSGFVDFPFVGEIYVKDLTLKQAQQIIEKEVGKFLNNISISVKFVNNTVSLLGEIRRPGEYPFYRDQITILQAISYGGGFTDFGDKQQVILIRESENRINYHYLDLTDKNIVASDYYYIIPNDVLIVRPINQKFRNLSLVNWPLFLTTITTAATLYLLFSNR